MLMCCRYPPTIMVDGNGHYSRRPYVAPLDWCGEHKPKETDDAK
jgi:hypothetical protein